jgi:hypothetical protein
LINEVMGIVGAIGLTFLLFGLRHLILPSERAKKRRYITPIADRENHELNKKTVEDDAWLLWAPGLETDVRVDRSQSHLPGGERRKARRHDEGREDRTIGGEIR